MGCVPIETKGNMKDNSAEAGLRMPLEKVLDMMMGYL